MFLKADSWLKWFLSLSVLHITHLANISVHEAHVQKIVSLQRVKLLIPRASRISIELTMSKLMSSEFALRKVCKLITEFKLFEAVSIESTVQDS